MWSLLIGAGTTAWVSFGDVGVEPPNPPDGGGDPRDYVMGHRYQVERDYNRQQAARQGRTYPSMLPPYRARSRPG